MQALKSWMVASLFFCNGLSVIFSQAAVTSAGGDAAGSGGTSAYSIGQVAYTSSIGEAGTINQGVQQPYDVIMVYTKDPGLPLSATIFPNPTAASILLKMDEDFHPDLIEDLTYWVYDLNSRLLLQGPVTSAMTVLPMDHLIGSTYFLRVVQHGMEMKTFKIFKTN